jgi:hypothetical protein
VAIDQATETVWRLLKGGAAIETPEPHDSSRRYAELLSENLGQPGFRELLLVVHGLDAHRDPYSAWCATRFGGRVLRRARSARRAEAHDPASGTQAFAADVLAAALTVPG